MLFEFRKTPKIPANVMPNPFRFAPGLILVQVIALGVVLSVVDPSQPRDWLKAGAILLILTLIVSFWFDALARQLGKEVESKLRQQHAAEQEKLKARVEKEKHRILEQSRRELAREAMRVQTRANIKVGAALAAAAGLGALMVITQFMTLGMLMLFAAGGALGGYVWRGRQLAVSGRRSLKVIDGDKAAGSDEVIDGDKAIESDEAGKKNNETIEEDR